MEDSSHKLAGRILKALVFGALAGCLVLLLGLWTPGLIPKVQSFCTSVLDPFGQIFLRLLFFVIIPLVFASLSLGVAQLGRLDKLGPLAARTFSLFVANMAIAVAVGLVLMNLVKPGSFIGAEATQTLLNDFGGTGQTYAKAGAESSLPGLQGIVDMFMPKNLLGAITGQSRTSLGEVLPLILFAILVGGAATTLSREKRESLTGALEIISDLMTRIVHLALLLAPYAVPAMIFSVVVKLGPSVLATLGLFLAVCLLGLLIHLFVIGSLWLRLVGKRSPVAFFKTIKAVLVTAFSTSSSSATLPAALACAREDLGLSKPVAGFVLPLGATMNMSGTALYEGCVVLFVAQVYGVPLDLLQQTTLLVLAVLSSVAVAGIPGGSLPLIAGLLANFGVPPEGISIVLGVDRVLDMSRTVVNVAYDLITATLVDKLTPADSVAEAS